MATGAADLGPHGARGEAHRPLVSGRNGMVCAGHPLAAQAGVHALQMGGDAVDAALAVAAALGVVEPHMSGLGGDGFLMLYRADERAVHVVNATGPAPRTATLAAYAAGMPMKGIRTASVPGLVDGWLLAHQRHGRRSLAADFAPAIALARDGFPVSRRLALAMAGEPALRQIESTRAVFVPHGAAAAPGELLIQRDLAATLERLAADGRAYFYEGAVAEAIDRVARREGGHLSADDMASYHARWEPPVSTTYRGHVVYEAPPNSSGHVLLQMLDIVERFDVASLGRDSARCIHLMVEAKRLAFADRERYLADPDFVDVPIRGLLDKRYAAERAGTIDLARAAGRVEAGDPWRYEGRAPVAAGRRRSTPAREDTTCFVVVDRWGNAVAQLQSLQEGFGSGLVVEGTGILLNNRMTYWHLDPDHVDCLQPGKRVRHTMNPVVVTDRDGRLVLACGTPGADTQVQTNLQVMTHVLDFGLSVAEAVEAPRWRHAGIGTESTYPHGEEDVLTLESRFPADVVDSLRRRGQPVRPIGPWEAVGSEMMIRVDPPTGVLAGAADPRRDGYAIGY